MTDSIPRGREELTPAWFNRAVAAPHGLPAVAGLAFDDAVPQGMMSSTFRVLPTYRSGTGTAPASFIVKLSASDPTMRKRPATRQNCLKEVRFYQSLQARVDVLTPRCLLADVDVESGFHVLVLEDLGTLRQRTPATGCSRVQAEDAVAALARLHARWWDSPELEGLEWLIDPAPLDREGARSRHHQCWPAFREAAATHLPSDMLAFGEALGDRFADLMNHLLFAPPRTLRHGDFSLSNLFFAEHGQPVVIDWQMISRGKGAWDLAWFAGQSLTIEQRRAWESDLLVLYLQGLEAGGVRDYGLNDCLGDYRVALAQRFGTLISSVVALPFTAAQKAAILSVQVPRNVAAIRDHGGIELLR